MYYSQLPFVRRLYNVQNLAKAGLFGLAGFAGAKMMESQDRAAQKAAAGAAPITTPTPTADQTVDPGATPNTTNLGRAALISTSSMGVLGTDPTGRKRLLGN